MTMSVIFSFFVATTLALAPGLPPDRQLDEVRPRLEAAIQTARAQQLPEELLLSKVREGLAKNVPAEGIAKAVEKLTEQLTQARALTVAKRTTAPSAGLLRAMTEAQLAGVATAEIASLLEVEATDAAQAEAIAVLADLRLRGYEANASLPLVKNLLTKDIVALPQLAATLELVKQDYALTTTEAAQAVHVGLKTHGSLARAATQAHKAARTREEGSGSGKEDGAGIKGRGVQVRPGKGMGMGRGMGKEK